MRVKVFTLGDIHLGHHNTPTRLIAENINKVLKDNYKVISKVDMIVLVGDTFDRLLSAASDEFALSVSTIGVIVEFVAKHNIALRILEGTVSHDRGQGRIFQTIVDKFNVQINFAYINQVSIEINKKLGTSILYIPDLAVNATATFDKVLELLKENNLEKVDVCYMHGAFKYQLPCVPSVYTHDEESYLSVVRYFIIINHVHVFSTYKRIIAPGSFDRIAHGEEGEKGGLVFTYGNNKSDIGYQRIINHNAKKYITIDLKSEDDIGEILAILDKKMNDISIDTAVRVICKKEILDNVFIKSIQGRYNGYKIEFKKYDTITNENATSFKMENVNEIGELDITRDNILSLLTNELSKSDFSKSDWEIFKEEMKRII